MSQFEDDYKPLVSHHTDIPESVLRMRKMYEGLLKSAYSRL